MTLPFPRRSKGVAFKASSKEKNVYNDESEHVLTQ